MSDDARQYLIEEEPYYRPVADKVKLYEAAYSARMPVMLIGPVLAGLDEVLVDLLAAPRPPARTDIHG